jgi:hypothetical protein
MMALLMSREIEADVVGLPFGLDIKLLSAAEAEKSRDGRICACGHALTVHETPGNGVQGCFPTTAYCRCQAPVPVLEVSNKRFFMNSTRGWGEKHALSLGLFSLVKAGGKYKSLVDSRCQKCQVQTVRLIPSSLTENLTITSEPGVVNLLLCSDCWSDFPIILD